jgi:hypothetical protein
MLSGRGGYISFVDINLIVQLHTTPHSLKILYPHELQPLQSIPTLSSGVQALIKDHFYSGSNLQDDSVTPPFLMLQY